MLLLDGKSMDVYAFLNELDYYKSEVLSKEEDLMQATEQNDSTKFREILNSIGITTPEHLDWTELRTAFLTFVWNFKNDNQIGFIMSPSHGQDMSEDEDIEDLKGELAAHEEELAASREELEQAIEEGNVSWVRQKLNSLGVWIKSNLTWEALKAAVLAVL
jgi:hypothetical protein